MVVTPGAASRRRLLHRARPLSPETAARSGGWLILAPHPDDETLGAGGLIAALAAAGAHVTVAFLTDGAGSHVGAPGWSAARVAALRAAEARQALRALGHDRAPLLLGWRDAAPHQTEESGFAATVRRLVALCRRSAVSNIVSSWEGDPHCDHQAAARVAEAVAARLRVVPRFYAVWGWTLPDLERRLARWRAHAMPVGRWQGAQRRALGRHRTQLGGLITGAVDRFVLPLGMRRLVDARHALLLEARNAA